MFSPFSAWLRKAAFKSPLSVLTVAATYVDYMEFSAKLSGMPEASQISETARTSLTELNTHGIHVISGYWDPDKCARARSEIDRLIAEYPEYLHTNAKADKRIYGANNASPLIDEFARDPILKDIACAYNREPTRTAFTLSAKMPATPDNEGSGEGWHRDAFLRQFKAILYLSDVGPENGPFQFVRESHKASQVMRDIWSSRLGYMQYRLSEAEVARIIHRAPERLTTYLAKAGTLILVDTSSIHRGMPIKAGSRFALTNYYYPVDGIDKTLFQKFKVLDHA